MSIDKESEGHKKTLGPVGWEFNKEFVRLNPDAIDIGIGNDAASLCGPGLGESVLSAFHEFTDGGADVFLLEGVRLYARRRDRHVDVGTRKDFDLLHWETICDLLDKTTGG